MPELTTGVPFRVKEASFLQRLKTTTAPQHAALEEQPLLRALMTPAVTRAQYRHYLWQMKKIAQAYERQVLPLLAPFGVVPKQSSSALIEDDLQGLTSSNPKSHLWPAFTLPQNLALPFAWGFAYVMEGSKLGGRVIFKHLQKALGLTEEAGGAYLANAGADTGTEWKEFLQRLSAYAAAHPDEEAILDGAIFGFTSIHNYFEANGQPHDD